MGGLFPIPGTTMLVCSVFIWAFKLNLAATQLANILVTPLDLLFAIPFVRLGELIFFVQSPIAASELMDGLSTNFFGTLVGFAGSLLQGVVAWALVSALLTPLLYFILLPIVTQLTPPATKSV